MKTISFHSVKGGVGRTAAVINCANALCNMGKNVVVLELDLDAPGIALKPTVNDSGDLNKGPKAGYIDYLSYFHKKDHLFGDLGELPNSPDNELIVRDKTAFLQKIAFQINPPKANAKGEQKHIKYIIAGDDNQRYWWNLNSPWFHDFFEVSRNDYTEDGYFLLHKNRDLFKEELSVIGELNFSQDKNNPEKTDYLIVDCKSAREYASVPLYYWSDVVVLMFPHNAEGVLGAIKMEKAIRKCTESIPNYRKDPAHTIPVVCRVPKEIIPETKKPTEKTFGSYFDKMGDDIDELEHDIDTPKSGAQALSYYAKSASQELRESDLFFIQEAGTGIFDERTINDPEKFASDNKKDFGSYFHKLIEDQCRVYSQVFKFLRIANDDLSDHGYWCNHLIPARISEIRHDRNILMSNLDQAINTDGEKNVLLRNKTVQRLIDTLADSVENSISNPPTEKIEPKQVRSLMYLSFLKAGTEIGHEFGSGTFNRWKTDNSLNVNAKFDFEEQVKRWCRFDSDGAAFGKMTPDISNDQKEIEITWERSFLVSEKENAATGDTEFKISHPSLEFAKGYLAGNIAALRANNGSTPGDDANGNFQTPKPPTVKIDNTVINGTTVDGGKHTVPNAKLVFSFTFG